MAIIHIFVSDTHFGNGTSSDDSLCFEPLYIRFIEHLLSLQEKVILWHVGDLLELGQYISVDSLYDIPRVHRKVFELERKLYKVRFMEGNHDYQLVKAASLMWWETTSAYRVLPIGVPPIGDHRVLVHHGHFWDWCCKPGNPVGISATRLIGLMERAGWPDADKDLAGLRRYSRERHDKEAAENAKVLLCDYVIKGHTHDAHIAEYDGVKIFDMGSPITDPTRIPFVIIEDGEVRLEYYEGEIK